MARRISLLALSLLLLVPAAFAGKFSKYKGTYDGTAKIQVNSTSYKVDATTKAKTISNGRGAKFTLTTDSKANYAIKLTFESDGGCTFKFTANNLTITASGTYKRTSEKITFDVSAVLGGVNFTGAGTVEKPSDKKLKISGSLNSDAASDRFPETIKYRFSGKIRD